MYRRDHDPGSIMKRLRTLALAGLLSLPPISQRAFHRHLPAGSPPPDHADLPANEVRGGELGNAPRPASRDASRARTPQMRPSHPESGAAIGGMVIREWLGWAVSMFVLISLPFFFFGWVRKMFKGR